MLNAPQFFEATRMLGQRLMKEGGESPRHRIGHACCLATARSAEDHELGYRWPNSRIV